MKGIVLAAGTGSRLAPCTQVVCKHLLPLYDKPMIFYPIATLMQAGVREFLIVTTPTDLEAFGRLLGDGGRFGCAFSYAVQAQPDGGAAALSLGADFVGSDSVAVILGDNVFLGTELSCQLKGRNDPFGAVAFVARAAEPDRYGVVTFNESGIPVAIEEKPRRPDSRHVLTGLYFYENDVFDIAAQLGPSPRGELEITDILRTYLAQGRLAVEILDPDTAWFDTGTFDSLLNAAQLVRSTQQQHGLRIGSLEEIAWREGLIGDAQLSSLARTCGSPEYREYLARLVEPSA